MQKKSFFDSLSSWFFNLDVTQLLVFSNFLFVGVIILIYTYEKKTIHRYEHQIGQLEEKSRRTFMNPHFFFNALNGIQGMYISSGLKVTNRYITKLSKLLRFTMELNVNNYISLQEEIEYIYNYTDLMLLRTDNKFTFTFKYHTKKALEDYHLPPMLIQPLVENAILHGLLPSTEKGSLSLYINEKKEQLHVWVEDNGIGVSASKRKQKQTNRKSFGTKVLRERIGIYNDLHDRDIYFYLNPNSSHKSKNGTKALLILPIIDNPLKIESNMTALI